MRSRPIFRVLIVFALAVFASHATRSLQAETEAEAAIHRTLDRPITLHYDHELLADVVTDLQAKLGVPVRLDVKSLANAAIGEEQFVTFRVSDISARSAIALMLRDLDLTIAIQHETLLITTSEDADQMQTVRVYDVADLVDAPGRKEPNFGGLIDVITTSVAPTTWDTVGGPGSIASFEAAGIKSFIVLQTDQGHVEIERLLADLRAIRNPTAASSESRSSNPNNERPPNTPIVDTRLPALSMSERAFRQALTKPISLHFDAAPFKDVVVALKEKTGMPVVFDPASLENLETSRTSLPDTVLSTAGFPKKSDVLVTATVKDKPLESALQQILAPLDCTWTYDHESLRILRCANESSFLVTRAYDVSDLPAYRDTNGRAVADFQALANVLTATIDPASWDDVDGEGVVQVFHHGSLQKIVVRQTWKNHRSIEQLLTSLRKSRGPELNKAQLAALPLTPPSQRKDSKSRTPSPEISPAPMPDPLRDALITANSQFALDLYRQLCKSQPSRPQNILFSPASVTASLAMVHAGARGSTAEEIARTLHWTMPPGDVTKAFHSLFAALPNQDSPGLHWARSASIWTSHEFQPADGYRKTLRELLNADCQTLDFTRPDEARRTIHVWLNEKTAGNPHLAVPPEMFGNLTAAILADAVSFQGQWSEQFLPARTAPAPFYVGNWSTPEVPMMREKTTCRYGVVDDVQILEKPYRGQALVMMILLPDRNPQSLIALEQRLSADSLQQWSSQLKRQTIHVFLPRFRIKTDVMLNDVLKRLGISRAFQPGLADLSGVGQAKMPLWLGPVVHQASIEVDEAGTRAAAATLETMTFGGSPPNCPVFRADHPFVFLIRDRWTGNILFIGRLMSP
ncbi:MAG: serpin family protein [Thermoguttaceae bacterium]